MGLFSWLSRKSNPHTDRTARWVHAQIEERAQKGETRTLVDACAALSGHGAMLFGMVVPADLVGADRLREECLVALRWLLPALPDAECDYVFGVIERAKLPLDITARRATLTRTRAAVLERNVLWLREQIEERARAPDLVALADAWSALNNHGGAAFGMTVSPGLPGREALRDRCLAAIRPHIATLTGVQCADLTRATRGELLPLEIAARRAELVSQRAEKRAAELTTASGSEPRNAELEAALAADPDDAETSRVLGDWLQAQGHPRGELIALQLRAESEPAMHAAAAGHLAAHAGPLLGPLAAHQRLLDQSRREALTWRRGFIHRACLSLTAERFALDASVPEILEILLVHPSSRHLAELAIGMTGGSEQPLDDVTAVLARRTPASLRALHLGDFTHGEDTEMSWYEVGNLAPLWPAVSRLRHLIVQGGSFELGVLDLPALEHAEFRTGGLSAASAQAIAAARWPRLRHLDVWYGDANYGGETTLLDVQPLLARADLGALVHLGLKNAAFTDELCGAVAASPLAAQLTELDLSLGTLSDPGAAHLASVAVAFPRLERLDVSQSFLTAPALALLRSRFRAVVADDQKVAAADDRYPSVGE